MVIKLCIVPMLIPTVHVSKAIEITVLKGAGHDLNLLDTRANFAVYLPSSLPAYLRNTLNLIWLLNMEYLLQKTYAWSWVEVGES